VRLAALMSRAPQQSLPKQCPGWAELKAAYRLLNNPRVDPRAIQGPHRRHVRELCRAHAVVLCVQDTSDLDFTGRSGIGGLGKTGNGSGQGILQHTCLAVLPESDGGGVLGVLHQDWHARVERPPRETRKQRRARWRESQVWSDTIDAVGAAPAPGCRFIHVGDRHSDVWETFDAADAAGVGFVVRAMHDRGVEGDDPRRRTLWAALEGQPVRARLSVDVAEQRNGRGGVKRAARTADVSVRFANVTLSRPAHRDRAAAPPRAVWAVYLLEEAPPAGAAGPLEWMLLTGEPVAGVDDASRIVGYYGKRWVIEEFHRVEKEGCRLEHTQLDHADDVARLAAVVAVIATRLLHLRDLARRAASDPAAAAGTPRALAARAPASWIAVVAKLAKVDAAGLTPQLFWHTLARRGGHVGRKSDGPPGWKTIWRGFYDVQLLVEGYECRTECG
jgi:hypothetical protein